MADDILSQEEVDALLRGSVGGNEAEEDADPSKFHTYDVGRQERIVRGRMPTLEVINERLARNLRVGLFNFMRRTTEISAGPIKVQKYAEFIRNLIVPTNLNIIQMKPLRGSGLFIFDPNLVFLVVDNLFGSDGRYHVRVEGRDFTQTEQRIIMRLLQVVMDEYAKAWEPVFKTRFVYVRSEMNTQFANVATPTEVVITFKFKIELGNNGGDFHVCLPYSMIEPLRETLYGTIQTDSSGSDGRWVNLMTRQIQTANVHLVANLASTQISLRELIDLKVGDVVGIDVPEKIVAEVEGVPLLEGRYGISQGHYALQVEQVLATEDDFSDKPSLADLEEAEDDE